MLLDVAGWSGHKKQRGRGASNTRPPGKPRVTEVRVMLCNTSTAPSASASPVALARVPFRSGLLLAAGVA